MHRQLMLAVVSVAYFLLFYRLIFSSVYQKAKKRTKNDKIEPLFPPFTLKLKVVLVVSLVLDLN